MTYIGQQPSTTFDSGIQDRFTGLSSNTVTLTHDISAETDILVVWNNIVQDSSTYSVGGTGNRTLTLGGTLVSADIVTVYYTNKVMQSVNPTANSVGITELNVSDGSNGQVLQTNGSGTLSFATPSSFDADGAVVFNESSNDVDFRVETNSLTHALVVNGGTDTVGIGSDPDLGASGTLHIKKSDSGSSSVNQYSDNLIIEESTFCGMSFLTGNSGAAQISFGDSDNDDVGIISYDHNSNFMNFHVNADEFFRINSNHSCNFNYGNNNNGAVTMYVNGQLNNTAMAVRHGTSSSTDEILIAFTDGADQACGQIRVNPNANTVSYGTSSDYRLKENVNYNFDATTELKKLKPAKFNWKTNPSLTIEGFIAHEVSDVVPLAVQGNKDETEVILNGVYNANGNLQRKDVSEDEWTKGKANGVFASDTTWSASKTIPKYQVIDQAKLVPLLVKTVQELEARIKTLEDA